MVSHTMCIMSSNTTTLLTPSELAAQLGVPVRTLGQWRYFGRGPAYVVCGRHIRYRPDDVDVWLESQTHGGPGAA
jgi:excisionase family DNA binding protein